MTTDLQPPPPLRQTPLHALHLKLGARMVPFAGYDMPVQYAQGLMAEHRHTREHACLFDVSHMGQISVSGPQAAQALEHMFPVDVLELPVNKQVYALMLNETGGILDDVMLINRGGDYLLVVNAACKANDLAKLQQHIGKACTVTALPDMALLALQGPQAAAVMHKLLPATSTLSFMRGMAFSVQGVSGYISRSGYTGEDGFEIAIPADHAAAMTNALLSDPEVQPAGLGARNSLRLEAGLCLYGQDMSAMTTPSEAGLAWSIPKVRRNGGQRAGGFIGAETVLSQLDGALPVQRQRIGLHGLERVPVRDGTPLHIPQGEQVGVVTSGLLSPTLDRAIAMGYVPTAFSAYGTRLDAMVRGKPVPMEVVPLPFIATRYRKS